MFLSITAEHACMQTSKQIKMFQNNSIQFNKIEFRKEEEEGERK